jgi:hypothetical protein
MMAAANLLSHKELGTARMTGAIEGRSLLRSAKDLGRVLSLAWLAGPDQTCTLSVALWRVISRRCWASDGRIVRGFCAAYLEAPSCVASGFG